MPTNKLSAKLIKAKEKKTGIHNRSEEGNVTPETNKIFQIIRVCNVNSSLKNTKISTE